MDELVEFDKLKTKVLKYILYKKRSEAEIRKKFMDYDSKMLDDVIEDLRENNYIDDNSYIERSVQEFMKLKNMSIKEIKYKLLLKGIDKDKIDDYICNNKEQLLKYELTSAQNILIKKQTTMEEKDILNYLSKKGYLSETVKIIMEEK